MRSFLFSKMPQWNIVSWALVRCSSSQPSTGTRLPITTLHNLLHSKWKWYQVNALDTGISINMFYGDPGEHAFLDKLFHPPFQVFIFLQTRCNAMLLSIWQFVLPGTFLPLVPEHTGAEQGSWILFKSCLASARGFPHSFVSQISIYVAGNPTFCAEAVARESHQRPGGSFDQKFKVSWLAHTTSQCPMFINHRLPPLLPLPWTT